MTDPVSIERLDHLCIAHLSGEIDLANADAIQRATLGAFEDERMLGLVVDLGAVTFLDSAGIRMLFGLHADVGARGRSMVVVVPHDATFRRVLAITGVPDVLATAATIDDAVEMLGSAR